jgi:hypothetical protein
MHLSKEKLRNTEADLEKGQVGCISAAKPFTYQALLLPTTLLGGGKTQ